MKLLHKNSHKISILRYSAETARQSQLNSTWNIDTSTKTRNFNFCELIQVFQY